MSLIDKEFKWGDSTLRWCRHSSLAKVRPKAKQEQKPSGSGPATGTNRVDIKNPRTSRSSRKDNNKDKVDLPVTKKSSKSKRDGKKLDV